MNATVEHKGTITKVNTDSIIVNIAASAEECSGCAISAMCGKSDTLEIAMSDPSLDLLGKTVIIGTSISMQRYGTLLFFVIPMVILFVVMFTLLMSGASEGKSCIFALISITIWYIILFTLRFKIQSKAKFSILRFQD